MTFGTRQYSAGRSAQFAGCRLLRANPGSTAASSTTFTAGCKPSRLSKPVDAFTLIELILVMAILTMAVAVTAPVLSNFFRGRSLDSEARRLLALTHGGQTRAVSEGVPMDLWIDANEGKFGLDAEPSYETIDSKAVEFNIDSALRIEAIKQASTLPSNLGLRSLQPQAVASVPPAKLTHPGLQTIRFLPDGTIAETSPQKLCLTARDGSSLWLSQTRDRLSYEIRSSDN
jgi:prepilin-type N-terminal cleavage/methylation domain-containing protein